MSNLSITSDNQMDNPAIWQCLLTFTCSMAVTVNAILLFLIFRYSTTEIKIYKYFLANLTISDLTAALLFLLFIPYPTIGNGVYGGFVLGPVRILQSAAVSNWIFITLVVAFSYCSIALVLTFVYRYTVLCDQRIQEKVLSKNVIYPVAGVIFLVCVTIGVTLNAARKFDISKAIKDKYPQFTGIPDYNFLGFDETNSFLPLNNCLCIGLNIVCDIIMATFGYKTMTTLSKQRSKMREQTYRMHKRLMHALIVQALLPLIVFCIPVVSFIVSILLQMTNSQMNCIAVLLISLHPACNAIVTIYFIRPYRLAISNTFRCRSTRFHEVVSSTAKTHSRRIAATVSNQNNSKF